ncbi:MAG TPA: low affinity iron permease family protein [Fimbriimonadales bacterium]|nr:low affinity iron permease family protein [Fimbriimonadales bacterium]
MKSKSSQSSIQNLVVSTTWFSRFAKWASRWTGHPFAFLIALAIILIWLITGPMFRFSDTWQLVINTATTIITFLMVFIIQNTQMRDTAAMQIKLDELLRATKGAHNSLLDLEELDMNILEKFQQLYEELARKAREEIKSGKADIGTPEI